LTEKKDNFRLPERGENYSLREKNNLGSEGEGGEEGGKRFAIEKGKPLIRERKGPSYRGGSTPGIREGEGKKKRGEVFVRFKGVEIDIDRRDRPRKNHGAVERVKKERGDEKGKDILNGKRPHVSPRPPR